MMCVQLTGRNIVRCEEYDLGLTHRKQTKIFVSAVVLLFCAACSAGSLPFAPMGTRFVDAAPWQAAAPAQAQSTVTQSVGTVKALAGNVLTLKLDSGAEVTVNVQDTTKIVQVAPGQKDLKAATAIQISDLQVGDRILVRSKASDDAKSISALGIIAMKRTDVDAKQTQDRDDWQKRGVGGLIKEVDATTGNVTISAPAAAGVSKTIVIHTTKATVLRRYAPDSVKFDEAKAAPLDQIKAGDQLRARGEKIADGDEFNAVEIVSGTFRNIAGTITSVDATAKTISLVDLISKKPMVVKISDESQLKKLPPEVAQRIAMRLRGGANGAGASGANSPGGGGAGGGAGSGSRGSGAAAGAAQAGNDGGNAAAGGGMQRPGGARPDFQQLVARLPNSTLADFQKGDAVLVVSTQGTDAGGVTAITLVGGVEPILAAAPGGAGQAMTLSPWSLGAPGGEAGGGTQ
jgi:transcription antitermination factor NusG